MEVVSEWDLKVEKWREFQEAFETSRADEYVPSPDEITNGCRDAMRLRPDGGRAAATVRGDGIRFGACVHRRVTLNLRGDGVRSE